MLCFADTICLRLQEKNGVGKANLKYFNVITYLKGRTASVSTHNASDQATDTLLKT